ncbi:MAG: hypothetical protein E7387_08020 [Ruminococcaceae bacterium]|nr:hypothetical protein [Oscillospiraceae bacterium]
MARKEYSYEYEEGKIVRATECNLDIENEHILHKSVVNTIKYYYDAEERITKVTDSVERVTEYTYNANGIRTSKTVNGIKHTYALDGTKILREEWAGNTIVPLM